MSKNYLIVGLDEVEVHESGELVGVKLETHKDGNLSIGLHPEMAHDFAMAIIKRLSEATNQGILPQHLEPIGSANIHGETTPAGIDLTFDFPNRGPRLSVNLDLEAALHLLSMVSDLVDDLQNQNHNIN